MEKFNIDVEKYSFTYDENEIYNVFVVPSQDNKYFTNFYIQKENMEFISFCIALNMKEMNCTNQDFINNNIIEWIDNYEDDIEILEDARIENE